MRSKLSVVKADGFIEEYVHTKVIGTISNALADVGQPDICLAEQLADVVTYYLYQKENPKKVTTDEIFSIIKAVLSTTGNEEAATELSESRCMRRLKRSRIEVISVNMKELEDTGFFSEEEQFNKTRRWQKSVIVSDLVNRYGLDRQTARMIASTVEGKILGMGITLVPTSLIKQIVLNDAAAALRARKQMQMV
jgi:hypothetical protein